MKEMFNKIKPIVNKIAVFYKKISDIATPTAVLAVICIIVTLALSSTNALTHKKIDDLANETKNVAMSKLIEADEYHELQAMTTFGDVTYNAAIKNNETIGCIFTVDTKGYGGTVTVMTAINMSGAVVAVEILDVSGETPGLGQNVTKPEWYAQFADLKDEITVVKGGTAVKENNEINAVTGATISSKAVTKAVNTALDYAAEIIVKGDELE